MAHGNFMLNDAFPHHKANPSLSLSLWIYIRLFELQSQVGKSGEPRQESVVVTQVEFAWMQLDAWHTVCICKYTYIESIMIIHHRRHYAPLCVCVHTCCIYIQMATYQDMLCRYMMYAFWQFTHLASKFSLLWENSLSNHYLGFCWLRSL